MILKRFLDWIEKFLPGILLAFGAGYREGNKKSSDLQKTILDLETEKELESNKDEVAKNFNNMSDRDVVDRIAKRGRKD